MCLSNFSHIFFSSMAAQNAWGHKSKFYRVVFCVYLMIWLTFGKNSLKTRWLTEDIKKNGLSRSFWAQYLINRWLDHIQILCGGYLGISDNVINFWEECFKNKMAEWGYFEINSCRKSLRAWYLMNGWFDRIQIYCGGSLGISDDLFNIWS